jgi:hypothetical protein
MSVFPDFGINWRPSPMREIDDRLQYLSGEIHGRRGDRQQPFLGLAPEIEKRAGRPRRQISSSEREAYFRDLGHKGSAHGRKA